VRTTVNLDDDVAAATAGLALMLVDANQPAVRWLTSALESPDSPS
jgi:hypothetical protein